MMMATTPTNPPGDVLGDVLGDQLLAEGHKHDTVLNDWLHAAERDDHGSMSRLGVLIEHAMAIGAALAAASSQGAAAVTSKRR
jgi:hypothetical protein